MGKPADVAGFHWRKRRVRKERSDGIAIVAPVRQSRQRQVRIPLQDMGKPADVASFHWRKRRVRKERSDGIAIVAPVRQSRQRQVRIPLQDTGKPADVAGFHWRKRRDSNPRGLSPKRFSRPPRYDHFDTLPCAFIVARIVQSFNNMRITARSCKNRRQSQRAALVHLSCLRLGDGIFVEVGGGSDGYCALQTLFEKFAAVCVVAVD